MAEKVVSAALLIIGDEILSGRTKDANLAYLGEALNRLGIRLLEARVIPDIPGEIVAALNAVRARYDYIFTTGGIGPTHDDITAECVAQAFGLPLTEHPEARAILEAHYGAAELNPARLRMAKTPDGASLIENPVSKAPGFRIENVFVMAGIPKVMQAQFESLAPGLVGGRPAPPRNRRGGIGPRFPSPKMKGRFFESSPRRSEAPEECRRRSREVS